MRISQLNPNMKEYIALMLPSANAYRDAVARYEGKPSNTDSCHDIHLAREQLDPVLAFVNSLHRFDAVAHEQIPNGRFAETWAYRATCQV